MRECGYLGLLYMSKNDVLPLLEATEQIQALSHDADTTLEHVLSVMSELSAWLIRSGIGYTEFSAALKPVFYNEALRELDRIKQKKTDSSISLLSGITRREVSTFRQDHGHHQKLTSYPNSLPVSVPARVVALWISSDLPDRLIISGEKNSFEYLVRQISTEKHPRSILLELKRLGIVGEDGDHVILQINSFTPQAQMNETKQLFIENLIDHVAAGVHNLTMHDNAFLEQAIFADELTPQSIEKLKQQSLQLWENMSKQLLLHAIELCKQDTGDTEATRRFRLGIYQYDAQDEINILLKEK